MYQEYFTSLFISEKISLGNIGLRQPKIDSIELNIIFKIGFVRKMNILTLIYVENHEHDIVQCDVDCAYQLYYVLEVGGWGRNDIYFLFLS